MAAFTDTVFALPFANRVHPIKDRELSKRFCHELVPKRVKGLGGKGLATIDTLHKIIVDGR